MRYLERSYNVFKMDDLKRQAKEGLAFLAMAGPAPYIRNFRNIYMFGISRTVSIDEFIDTMDSKSLNTLVRQIQNSIDKLQQNS